MKTLGEGHQKGTDLDPNVSCVSRLPTRRVIVLSTHDTFLAGESPLRRNAGRAICPHSFKLQHRAP
jgi:hypothetical protein